MRLEVKCEQRRSSEGIGERAADATRTASDNRELTFEVAHPGLDYRTGFPLGERPAWPAAPRLLDYLS